MVDEQAPATASPAALYTSLALAAALCWTGALTLLLLADLRADTHPLALQRLIYYVLVLGGGLLTFVPIQQRMELPGLAFEGVIGSALLLYALAFVPPPTGWLFALPDLPVYLLLILSVFWTVAALALPFVYAIGQRMFRQRLRRLDIRRARRQAHLIGLFAACILLLASLRVLTWVSLLLLTLILVIAELLFLSRVPAEEPV